MKRRSKTPTNVTGMQNTPSNRSEMAKFSKNILVTERIELSKVSVIITRRLPTIDNINIIRYGNIKVNIVYKVNIDPMSSSNETEYVVVIVGVILVVLGDNVEKDNNVIIEMLVLLTVLAVKLLIFFIFLIYGLPICSKSKFS